MAFSTQIHLMEAVSLLRLQVAITMVNITQLAVAFVFTVVEQ